MVFQARLLALVAAVCLLGCGQPGQKHAAQSIEVPDALLSDPNAQQVASIWADGEEQTFLLEGRDGWPDEAWGLLEADFLRHAAKMRAGTTRKSEAEILAAMKKAFDAEWENPTTDIAEGMD